MHNVEILKREPRAEVLELVELFKQLNDCGRGALYATAEHYLVKSIVENRRLPFDTNGIEPFVVQALFFADALNDEWLLKLKKRASELAEEQPRYPKTSAVVINLSEQKGRKATTA